MGNKIKILLTGAGSPGAPGIIKSLKIVKRKIEIVGVDMRKNASGFSMVDKHYIIPQARDKNFISCLLDICKKERPNLLISLVTAELEELAKNRNKFLEIGVKLTVPPLEILQMLNNKYLLMDFCLKNGISTPTFTKVESFSQFEEAVFDLGYPMKNVCFKPPISNGQRGFRILSAKIDRFYLLMNEKPTTVITTFEEIKEILKNRNPFPPLIVMEYLPNAEYTVDSLAIEGKAITVIPRLREEIKLGISVVGKVVKEDNIIKEVEKLLSLLHLTGNIGFQFKKDEHNIPKIIECNPRLQGTTVLCTAAGANLVYLGVKVALEEEVSKPKVKWGTKMIRYWEGVYYDKDGYAYTL
jgi:carbamoyl-phosphate synthase large subunit